VRVGSLRRVPLAALRGLCGRPAGQRCGTGPVACSRAESPKRANGDPRPYYDAAKDRRTLAVELEATGDGRRRRKRAGAYC
jgi:hypothetical protein